MKKPALKYRTVGTGPFAVEEIGGGIVYDLIDSKTEARRICSLLNDGIGPEWDAIEPRLKGWLQA